MASSNQIYQRVFLCLIVTLILCAFGFTTTKLDKTVYAEHKEAQDAAFQTVSDKIDGVKQGVDALLSREIKALQKAAAKK